MSNRRSESEATINAQKMALINIYVITLFRFPPKVVTINVPITGEKKIGVKKDTPNSP